MAIRSKINLSHTRFFYKLALYKRETIDPKYKYKRRHTSRSCVVIKPILGYLFYIYRGNSFKKIKLNRVHLGFKLGEFAFTRKPYVYPSRFKKKKNINRR